MKETPETFETALDAAQKGHVCIPCYPGTKVPAVSWKQYQTTKPTEKEYREWFSGNRNNIAIICSNMVVFDVDDPALVELVLLHCGDTPHKVHTPGGGTHLGYRKRKGVELTNRVRILRSQKNKDGKPIDIRTDGGLEMIPPSETEEGKYEWLSSGLRPIHELPYGNIGWTRERAKRVVRFDPVERATDPRSLLFRGQKYIDTFDKRAMSGQGGHTTFFVHCLKIVRFARKLGADENEIWQLVLYCNETKCDPPWDPNRPDDERALRHKFNDALKKAS